jgi:phosphatidylinositol alpha 1,6-mannosyltransferase
MADTTIVFYGIKLEVSDDDLEKLESRSHPMQIAARKAVEHRTWDYINAQLIDHYRDAIFEISKKRGMVA